MLIASTRSVSGVAFCSPSAVESNDESEVKVTLLVSTRRRRTSSIASNAPSVKRNVTVPELTSKAPKRVSRSSSATSSRMMDAPSVLIVSAPVMFAMLNGRPAVSSSIVSTPEMVGACVPLGSAPALSVSLPPKPSITSAVCRLAVPPSNVSSLAVPVIVSAESVRVNCAMRGAPYAVSNGPDAGGARMSDRGGQANPIVGDG